MLNDRVKEDEMDQQIQRGALEQVVSTLNSLHYPSSTTRRPHTDRNTSLQDFEANYQELWDWLMDMEAMVTDSHQLMMSEEQKGHLFKVNHPENVRNHPLLPLAVAAVSQDLTIWEQSRYEEEVGNGTGSRGLEEV
ncbi:unnamed protein product [Gadus morhua 'NCC']